MAVTTSKKKHIDQLHFEHQLWSSEAKFYADELAIYKKRLADVAAANTGTEIRKQIEQFQNKFIVQKEQLDTLSHEIRVHEDWLAQFAKEHPEGIDQELFADHKVMKENVESFRKLFGEFKKDFKGFLAERL